MKNKSGRSGSRDSSKGRGRGSSSSAGPKKRTCWQWKKCACTCGRKRRLPHADQSRSRSSERSDTKNKKEKAKATPIPSDSSCGSDKDDFNSDSSWRTASAKKSSDERKISCDMDPGCTRLRRTSTVMECPRRIFQDPNKPYKVFKTKVFFDTDDLFESDMLLVKSELEQELSSWTCRASIKKSRSSGAPLVRSLTCS